MGDVVTYIACGARGPGGVACGRPLIGPNRHPESDDHSAYTSHDCPVHGEVWIQSDVGQLDLGVRRAEAIASPNRYATFAEQFEGLAFVVERPDPAIVEAPRWRDWWPAAVFVVGLFIIVSMFALASS